MSGKLFAHFEVSVKRTKKEAKIYEELNKGKRDSSIPFVHKYKNKARILKVIRVSSIRIKRHIKLRQR